MRINAKYFSIVGILRKTPYGQGRYGKFARVFLARGKAIQALRDKAKF